MIEIMLRMPGFYQWNLNMWQTKHMHCSGAAALLANLSCWTIQHSQSSTAAMDAAVSATALLCSQSVTDYGRQTAPGPVLQRAVCVQQHASHVIGAAGHGAQHQAQPRHVDPAAIEHRHQLVQSCATRTAGFAVRLQHKETRVR